MTKDFINAVKRYVKADVDFATSGFSDFDEKSKELAEAEAHLDSFGAEEKKGICMSTEHGEIHHNCPHS